MRSELLGNITIKIGSGATPKGGDSAYQDEGISFIRSQNILDYEFNKGGLAFINSDQAEKLNNVTVESKDILLNITGDSIARACMVPDHILPARVNQHVSIIRCKHEYNPKYILYYLIHLKPYLLKICGVGGTRNALTKDVISNLPIKVQRQQIQIAKVLSDLDSKMELNSKINAELEAMAKLIYDYWFVQFDFPNAKNKPYKTSGGKMVWSKELKKEIPKDWKAVKMSDWIDIDKSGDWGKEEPEGNFTTKVTCIRGADINGLNGLDKLKPPTRYILEKNSFKILKSHDIIIEISGGSPTQSTGRLAFITEETVNRFENPLICSNFCKPISMKNDKLLYNFVYNWNKLYDNGVLFGYEGKTSGIKNLLLDSFVNSQYAVVPDENTVNQFYSFMEIIQKKKQTTLAENKKLSELRDWLLPMLMNGQVTIKASENKIKRTAKPFKPANTYFHQTQVLGAIINASKQQGIKHGEMTLAKYSYLVDRLYKIPTSFKYDRWHLGPYPTEMKKVVNNKKFFKIQNNEVSVVPQRKQYHFQFQQQVEEAVAELASIFSQYKGKDRSHQTELLATVCKVVEDIKSMGLKPVRQSMKKWPIELKGEEFKNKAEKFGEGATKSVLKFIVSKGWDKLLIQNGVTKVYEG